MKKLTLCFIITISSLIALNCSGADGKDGDTGVPGPAGPTGPQGNPGDQGETGLQGENGSDGTSITEVLCFGCHDPKTTTGAKVKNAQNQWAESIHALGYHEEGSNAFYANAEGCQVCHTAEGFMKLQNGDYANQAAIDADVIQYPSSLNCSTCHDYHGAQDFSLRVENGTSVALQTGSSYNKSKGSICASCHKVNLFGEPDVITAIVNKVNAGFASYESYWGPHHGPQADMFMGSGGAEYSLQTYSNGNHLSFSGADCLQCHMTLYAGECSNPAKTKMYQCDSSIGETWSLTLGRIGFGPNIGGHSFNISGEVHGSDEVNITGCNHCHTNVRPDDNSALSSNNYFKTGQQIIVKDTTFADIDSALSSLVDPSGDGSNTSCGTHPDAGGQITSGVIAAFIAEKGLAGAPVFTVLTDDASKTYDCAHTSWSGTFKTASTITSAEIETDDYAQVAMALWNYKFVKEDRSFGVHNYTYAKKLLYDSCKNLCDEIAAGSTYQCTTASVCVAP